jgi:hypothetical protein
MAGIVICEMDLSKLMLAKYQPRALTQVGSVKAKLTLEDKNIIQVVDDDPLLQQKMVDAGQHVFRSAGDEMAKLLQDHDKQALQALLQPEAERRTAQIAETFKKKLESEGKKAGQDADKAAAKVWADLIKTRKEYSKYKWKTGFNIFLGMIGLGTGIAAAVVTSASGVGAVVAAYGAYQSAMVSIIKIRDALKSASDIYLRLSKDLGKLLDQYEEFDKKTSAAAKKTAQEVLAAASEKFLAIEVRSLSKCGNDLGLFRNKLKGAEVDAHSASADLNKALKEWDKAMAEIKSGSPVLRERARKINDLTPIINDTIAKVVTLMEEVRDGQVNSAKIEQTINTLKQGVNPTVIKAARVTFGLATGALLIFAKGVPDMEVVATSVKVGVITFRKTKELYEELSK